MPPPASPILKLAVTVEPSEGGTAHYLRCASPAAGGAVTGDINLSLSITNTLSRQIRIHTFEISVLHSPTEARSFSVDWILRAGERIGPVQPEDYVFAIPSTLPPNVPDLRLKFFADGFVNSQLIVFPLAVHLGPTPGQSLRFWAAVRDLRPGEFWRVHGTSHPQDNPAQLYGYDVDVRVEKGNGHDHLLPDTDGTKNEDYRVWGKPVYAVADGTVRHFRNDFPTNQVPGPRTLAIEDLMGTVGDGNGNFITIQSGDETVLYAHLMPGWLNESLLAPGAVVREGDFLGYAGNSGNSDHPHLHIHSNRSNTGSKSWVDAPRPMRFRNARAVAWTSLERNASAAPWVKLSGLGLPTADCAVWPSDDRVVDLKETTVRHFTISSEGQVWVVKRDNRIRTASERLSEAGAVGVFLDIDPSGHGKEIAVHGQKPYVIGQDDKIREGLPAQWAPLPGSPACRRLAIDDSSGKVWVVTTDSRIMSFDTSWVEHPGGGRAKDIALHNGLPYIVGSNDKIWKSVGPNGWVPLSGEGKGKRIAVNQRSGRLWVVGMNDGLWSRVGAEDWDEHPGGGRAKELFFYKSKLFIIGLDDGIWRSAGQFGWQKLNLVEPA